MAQGPVSFYVAQLNPTVGAISDNADRVVEAYKNAVKAGAALLLTPECVLSGYPSEDLTKRAAFLDRIEKKISELTALTENAGTGILLGTPYRAPNGGVYNAALYLANGEIKKIIAKTRLPDYGVFDDSRIFSPGSGYETLTIAGVTFGILICEDMWFAEGVKACAEAGAQALISLNASPFEAGKTHLRQNIAADRVSETGLPILSVFQTGGQDELVFDGGSFALNVKGDTAFRAPFFEECEARVTFTNDNFNGKDLRTAEDTNEDGLIYRALTLGLRDYAYKNGFKGCVLGLSGGADSALVAALAVDALGAENVACLILPSRYTSQNSLDDAESVLKNLNIKKSHRLSIEKSFDGVTETLAPVFADKPADVTEENIQSRLRAVLLNAYSNKFGALLLTTGNKSEMSVGYATLYGDMCGGFNPIKDVYKCKVYDLCRYRNRSLPQDALGPAEAVIPDSILTKAPTAELRADQKDSDSLPDYPILDRILYKFIEEEAGTEAIIAEGFDRETVFKVRNLLFLAEYKRRQAPPGVKITAKAFGRDRRYPITNGFRTENW